MRHLTLNGKWPWPSLMELARSVRGGSSTYLIVALLSFLSVSSIVRVAIWQIGGLDEYDPFTQKFLLAQHQVKPIDILFVGPSYVDEGVDPFVFEREMATLGHPVSSFNLGIGALGWVELEDLVKNIQQMKNCCKYVLFVPSFGLFYMWHLRDNVRAILFMDIEHAIEEVDFMLATPAMPGEPTSRAEYLADIVEVTFRHYTNLGLVTGLLGLSQGARNWKSNPTWDRRGYTYADTNFSDPTYGQSLASMLKYRPDYTSRAKSDHQPSSDSRFTTTMIDRVVRLGHEIERNGAVPLVLLPPKIGFWDWDVDFLAKFSAKCGETHILDFSEPTVFPELYASGVHSDGSHLNGLGASIWSERLAQGMAKLLDHGGPVGTFCGASAGPLHH
jgi:hypothetical protein